MDQPIPVQTVTSHNTQQEVVDGWNTLTGGIITDPNWHQRFGGIHEDTIKCIHQVMVIPSQQIRAAALADAQPATTTHRAPFTQQTEDKNASIDQPTVTHNRRRGGDKAQTQKRKRGEEHADQGSTASPRLSPGARLQAKADAAKKAYK